MQGVLLGFISLCSVTLVIVSGPVLVYGVPSLLRHRRQDDMIAGDEPTVTTEVPTVTTEVQTTTAELNFDKLFEDLFKNLGLEMNETKTNNEGSTTFQMSATGGELDTNNTVTNPGVFATPTAAPSWDTQMPDGTENTMVPSETPLPGTDNTSRYIDYSSTTYNPENETFLSTVMPEDLTSLPTTNLPTTPLYITMSTEQPEDRETTTNADSQECYVTPRLMDFCIIPEDLTEVLGPGVTLHDVSDFVLSMDIVHELIDHCPAGSWCLNSEHSYDHLEEKVAFWTNSSDFLKLCWPPLDACLRSVVDQYSECENYEMYMLIADMNKLLCEMKEEPRASRDCIEQTMKALHVSMADFHRNKEDLEDNDDSNICQRRNTRMTSNYLCATAVCGMDGDLLNEFEPWSWFVDDVELYRAMCVFDRDKCITQKEEVAEVEEEEKEEEETQEEETPENTEEVDGDWTDGDNDDDESKEHEGLWVAEEMDVPTAVIIGAISLATVGFLVLLAAIWWVRQRRSKHRVREGVEYMQILPDMDD